MDLEYLRRRHDEELAAAANAACAAARGAHEKLARAYDEAAGRIGKPVAVGSSVSQQAETTANWPGEARTG